MGKMKEQLMLDEDALFLRDIALLEFKMDILKLIAQQPTEAAQIAAIKNYILTKEHRWLKI